MAFRDECMTDRGERSSTSHGRRETRGADMILYYHPLSSCSWKVLIALYENGTPFEPRMLDDPAVAEAWLALWPLGKFPVLRDEERGRTGEETSRSEEQTYELQ